MIALIMKATVFLQNKNVLLSSEIFRIFVAKHINYGNILIFMAKGIEPTPILRGKDAERLLEEFRNPPNPESRAAILREARRIYKKIPLIKREKR